MPVTPRAGAIEAMLAKTPDDPFLHYGLAMEFVKAGQADEGVRRLTELTSAHPGYQATYLQLGQLLANRGDIDEARGFLQRGISAAQAAGDSHAAGEMEGLLHSL